MKLLLKVRYDGSYFNGSQVQPGVPTVQGALCAASEEIFGFPCDVTGCSRTDAGVHAKCYVASVYPTGVAVDPDGWCTVPTEKVGRAYNSVLPPYAAVCGAAVVPDSFHPRYDVVYKEYEYLICDAPCRDPFLLTRAWNTGRRFTDEGIGAMKDAARRIVGKKDFRCFMASGSDVKDTVRNVSELTVGRVGEDVLKIGIRADGFLYNMVRIIAGTLAEVGFGKIAPDSIDAIIASGDRSAAGMTAPASGLYLSRVDYGRVIDWKFE